MMTRTDADTVGHHAQSSAPEASNADKSLADKLRDASKIAWSLQGARAGPLVSTTSISKTMAGDTALRDVCTKFSGVMVAATAVTPMVLAPRHGSGGYLNIGESRSNPCVTILDSKLRRMFRSISLQVQWYSPAHGFLWDDEQTELTERNNGPSLALIAHMSTILARNTIQLSDIHEDAGSTGPDDPTARGKHMLHPTEICVKISHPVEAAVYKYRVLKIDPRDDGVVGAEHGIEYSNKSTTSRFQPGHHQHMYNLANCPHGMVIVQVVAKFTHGLPVRVVLGKRSRSDAPAQRTLQNTNMEPALKKRRRALADGKSARPVLYCTPEEQIGAATDRHSNHALSGFPRAFSGPSSIGLARRYRRPGTNLPVRQRNGSQSPGQTDSFLS